MNIGRIEHIRVCSDIASSGAVLDNPTVPISTGRCVNYNVVAVLEVVMEAFGTAEVFVEQSIGLYRPVGSTHGAVAFMPEPGLWVPDPAAFESIFAVHAIVPTS